ncbi:MAG: NADP-specific glutamate dehydrogenase [Nannocystaceae bacterium]
MTDASETSTGDCSDELAAFMTNLERRNPGEREFHQAAREIAASVLPFIRARPEYRDARILDRLTEPDRIISFRVCWERDDGGIEINRAWRVQLNGALGPYKGGLRFHPSVNASVLKFLALEQSLKNSLTGLPLGAGKGGADFDPKGRSDREVMRFCQSLMTELAHHIGPDTDVPAGDIGVGAREIGYLFGHYRRQKNAFEGALTGKGLAFGGSPIRREATGWGCIYFLEEMLEAHDRALDGMRVVISGAGNVALYAAEKALERGAVVLTLSDSDGVIHDPEGLTSEKLAEIMALKFERRGRLREYAEAHKGVEFREKSAPWGVDADVALPCATQNELDRGAAERLIEGGVVAVCEGANMPCTTGAAEAFAAANVLFAPGKAANAGGVAISGVEQTQNATRMPWSAERVNEQLREIMQSIHRKCVDAYDEPKGKVNDYVRGANIAGFRRLADAMLAYGVV